MLEKTSEKIVILGTGGTIAGTSSCRTDNVGYAAAQLSVDQLISAVPGLQLAAAGSLLVSEQVAQIDSKDMSFAVWQKLASRVNFHLHQRDVRAVVITHGTDTLEETAYFLHSVLESALLAEKPVVLTCAMRPATSAAPDGPQNLTDALTVAASSGAAGVLAVCAGTVHGAVEVQKVHPYRLDAFNSGDAGPMGYIEEGNVRWIRGRSGTLAGASAAVLHKVLSVTHWPRVEIVMNYVGASGAIIDAMMTQTAAPPGPVLPVQGLVVDATGNGTVHQELESALLRAQFNGVAVVLASRCPSGRVLPTATAVFSDSQGLSPVKARVALMLKLMA